MPDQQSHMDPVDALADQFELNEFESTPIDESFAPPGPAPLIEWLDPAPSTPITRDQAITVRVTDADLELAVLSARFAALGLEEVVWRDGAFASRYAASELVIAGAARTFTIRRTGGWPASVRLAVDAVDADGQVGSE